MSASMMYNGRLLGGLDFQDANANGEGSINSNQLIEDGNFVFVVFTVNTSTSNSEILFSRAEMNDENCYHMIFHRNRLLFRSHNPNRSVQLTNLDFDTIIDPGERILFGVNIHSATSYDYVVARYNKNYLKTMLNVPLSGYTGLFSDFDLFFVGKQLFGNELYTNATIHTFGLLGNTLIEQELIDFANSEAMRIPAGKPIKYYYDFREQDGNTLRGRGSGAVDLTLTNFLSTTKGDANNRWVNPYTLQPK